MPQQSDPDYSVSGRGTKRISKNKINTVNAHSKECNVLEEEEEEEEERRKKQANTGPLLTDVLIRRRWRQCGCEKESEHKYIRVANPAGNRHREKDATARRTETDDNLERNGQYAVVCLCRRGKSN